MMNLHDSKGGYDLRARYDQIEKECPNIYILDMAHKTANCRLCKTSISLSVKMALGNAKQHKATHKLQHVPGRIDSFFKNVPKSEKIQE